jgi:hypothetical protein
MGSRASKERKRLAVAQGKVAGKNSKQIAAELGVSPGYVDHLAWEPQTKAIVEELLLPHKNSLSYGIIRGLRVLLDGMGATKADGTPDQMVRQAAFQQWGEWCDRLKTRPDLIRMDERPEDARRQGGRGEPV